MINSRIMLIFKSFRIRPSRQPRVLKWGIIGAIVMRAGFIFAGIELLERFEWLIYLFGALLLYAAIGMLRGEEEEEVSNTLLPAENLLEDTDGLLRPPSPSNPPATSRWGGLRILLSADVHSADDVIAF